MKSPDDDTERGLRLELMRLDRQLKKLDIRRRDQQIAYQPLRVMFLAAGLVGIVAAAHFPIT